MNMKSAAYANDTALERLSPAARTGLLAGGAVCFALLTAASAHLRFYLPFTPVPVTMQVFVVLLSGAVLGRGWGAASQGMYVCAGLLGAPIFAGAVGAAILSGPTAGYLFGFMVAAPLTGAILARGKSVLHVTGAMAAGVGAIYLCGWAWLAFALRMGPAAAFFAGVQPFLLADMLKAAAASALFMPLRRAVRMPL
mgnify:CR=1 FL=1